MFLNERTKTGRAHFFFAFEDEFDVMFQQVVLHNILECLGLDERLALVVVGSACPNASVAHLSLEWFAFPKFERFCGHNVVVTVDEHRFGIGIYHLFAVNHRIPIRRHHLGTVYSGHQQQLFPPFGATLHVGFVRLLRANTGYADKAEKLIEHTFFVLLNILLNHLISYLGIILPRLRFVVQAVFWGWRRYMATCCSSIAVFKPCIALSPCFLFRTRGVDSWRFSTPFSHCLSSHSWRKQVLFLCLFSLAYDGLIASFARNRKRNGAKQRTFRLAKSKI